MISLARLALDQWDKGDKSGANEMFDRLPRFQLEIYFDDVSARCASRVQAESHQRPCNGLNVEHFGGSHHCLNRKPGHWPESATAMRWIKSGGSVLVFGECCLTGCPIGRTK